jgi:hypothetical protein
LLKKPEKEIVSEANVAMPRSFLKPLDYAVELLVRQHPTLRQYQSLLSCAETDPEFFLYPVERPRILPKDEIEMKCQKKLPFDETKDQYASK